MQNKSLRTLVECAIMLALATILAVLPVIKLPFGGSVTYASMVPIVLVSFRHGIKWGALTGIAFALIQMVTGFYPPPIQDLAGDNVAVFTVILYFAAVVVLDYLIAFGFLGLAGMANKCSQNKTVAVAVGSFVVTAIRYAAHFVSGIIVWGVYAEEGQPVWLYSLSYNGRYMIPEIIITTVVATLLYKALVGIQSKPASAS